MSLLLLLNASSAGRFGVHTAILTLEAPPASILSSPISLTAPTAEFSFIEGPATLSVQLIAPNSSFDLVSPPANLVVSGSVSLQAPPNILAFQSGNAGITIDLTVTVISLNGENYLPSIDRTTVTVTDVLDELPNTCSFETLPRVTKPLPGQELKIGIGTITNLAFAGHLTSVRQRYTGGRENISWECSAVDYTRLLDRRLILKRYPSQSASVTIVDIISSYTSGFTTINVVPGLAVIPPLDFYLEDPSKAITKIAKLIGAFWYIDYTRDLHFFITETIDAPDDISELTHRVWDLVTASDINQIRSSIIIRGIGSSVAADTLAGSSVIPVEDITPFSSGMAVSGPQKINYSGVYVGGAAATIGSYLGAPGSAPSIALGTGAGKIVGLVSYRVTFKNDTGETLPSSISNLITGVSIINPSGVLLAIASGLGRLIGLYSYRVSYITALGETSMGSSNSITASGAAVPTSISSLTIVGTIGPLKGLYFYAVTHVTQYGETLKSASLSIAPTTINPPSFVTIGLTGIVGPLIGAYSYVVTLVTELGETTQGTQQNRTGAVQPFSGNFSATASGIGPILGAVFWRIAFVTALGETVGSVTNGVTANPYPASAPTVSNSGTGFFIDYAVTYVHPVFGESALSTRTVVRTSTFVITVNGLPSGCGWNLYSSGSNLSGGPLYKVAELGVGVTSFTHASQSGPAAGVRPTMGWTMAMSSIQTGPSGTVARRIYRTKGGGSTYYLIGQINDNSSTAFTDNVADSNLSVLPSPLIVNGDQHQLSNIPLGPTGTLARRIYRTKAGGSLYFLLAELQNNSVTAYIDKTADNDLGAQNPPLINAAGGQVVSVNGIPVGPSGTIARRVYRTKSGGSAYLLLTEIQNNSTSTFVDSIPDESLGSQGPSIVSSAGGQNINLTNIPVGPTGTVARRIYRTRAGGSTYGLVGQLSDNTTSSFTDDKIDTELGNTAPVVNTAGASTINISSIPIGPTGITSRRLYRTEGGGAIYKFVTELKDNTTTTWIDGKADTELGDVAPDAATLGSILGTTTLVLIPDTSAFPLIGWGNIGSQQIFWTGKTGNTLTGIPASGPGSLKTNIKAGVEIVAESLLTGISGLLYDLISGDDIRIYVERNSLSAQSVISLLEGGDGVHQFPVDDNTLTLAGCQARGDAELALFSSTEESLTFTSRDMKIRSGKTISVNLGAPTNIVRIFKIQQVIITQFGLPNTYPLRSVTASSYLYTLDHLLHRVDLGD